MVKVKDLEEYMKEIKRKHLRNNGVRAFESTMEHVVFLVKGNKVKFANKTKIMRENSDFYSYLENFDKLQDARY